MPSAGVREAHSEAIVAEVLGLKELEITEAVPVRTGCWGRQQF